jgi:hypothetical protein
MDLVASCECSFDPWEPGRMWNGMSADEFSFWCYREAERTSMLRDTKRKSSFSSVPSPASDPKKNCDK